MFLYRFMNLSEKQLLLYQNYFTFSFCCYFLFLYDIYDRPYMEIYGSLYILVYMILDLFIFPKTWEYVIHHILSIILAIQDQYFSEMHQYQLLLFRTEYSTIILNLYHLSRQKFWLPIFIILFGYFRIINVFIFFISKKFQIHFYECPFIALFLLNLYWFKLIMCYIYTKLFIKAQSCFMIIKTNMMRITSYRMDLYPTLWNHLEKKEGDIGQDLK